MDFRFGVATADHQCEAYDGHDDIRDVWERVRGLTARGKATDFWNRYREDVDLAKGLGCRAFRLSLSWARLEPQAGAWDDAAFEHYREVLQYMRDAGMATVVTLHHNTWPLHVQAAGNGAGLLDPGFPARLTQYAEEVERRLGHLIDYYVTINEPNQLVYGFIKGWWMRAYAMPPGLEPFATGEEQMDAVLRLIPNLFLAHTHARNAIKKIRPEARVGANPLILGLPRWLQRIVDRHVTHLKSPEQLRVQGKRLTQDRIVDEGAVDISIAQITMTERREDRALFSEPYFTARLCTLRRKEAGHEVSSAGVVAQTLPAYESAQFFPKAGIRRFTSIGAAVDALRRHEVDAVFDDDVTLQPFASGDLLMEQAGGKEQHFAVAMALGSRTLLNAVDAAVREFKKEHGIPTDAQNRKNISDVGNPDAKTLHGEHKAEVPDMDASLQKIRERGVLRVGIHPGVPGLCMEDGKGGFDGLEPDLGRFIAAKIFGEGRGRVEFIELRGEHRLNATRSWLRVFDKLRKTLSLFATILGTNWWNLGLAGELAPFLCPPECVGTLDYVGLDYYWGVPSLWPSELHRLAAAAECRYGNAPVWPGVLYDILRETEKTFPGKPIVVIENGCVNTADDVTRADYLEAHIRELKRAIEKGVPVEAYLCWSITSNREWGLPFDRNSDFGLFHIDLDTDPLLKRIPTDASERYKRLIASFAS
jgi:beta-glucosidase/6-phospho-beta-glucosidase/beta-galactosidase/ABC-type amino acid transport substrate-binding protein